MIYIYIAAANQNNMNKISHAYARALILILVFLVMLSGNSGFCQQQNTKSSTQTPEYPDQLFQANDRVMFLGNSITHGGRYHSYIWLYYMTRFPDLRLTMLNGGVGGDIIANINNRLEEDILSKKPNIINLSFGMNDSGYFQYMTGDSAEVSDKLFFQCDSAFQLVLDKLKKQPGIKKIMMSGSPYDLNTKVIENNVFPPKPATFERITQLQRSAAEANQWAFVDIYHPMDALNKKHQQLDSNFTLSGSNDRIHPESYGHLIWAYLYLVNQGLKGHPVSTFTVDVKSGKGISQTNCVISNVSGNQDKVSFDYLAKSLPFPIDETMHDGDKQPASVALKIVPIMEDLNQEIIKLNNLKAGNYELSIDGKAMGTFTASVFSEGVNLAAIKTTPQYNQALEILKKNEERGSAERETRDYAVQVYNFARPNGITEDNKPESWEKMRKLKETNGWINNDLYERGSNPEYQKSLQDKMDRLTEEIYRMNKPVTHHIQVVKVH